MKQRTKEIFLSMYRKNKYADGCIYISTGSIRVLNNPDYITVYVSKDRKKIAVGPCRANFPMAFPTFLHPKANGGVYISSKQFVTELREKNELKRERSYQFKGFYDEKNQLVCYNLS